MSGADSPLREELLHAYVDEQLDPDEQNEVARALAASPALAERVSAWRRQRDTLRIAFGAVADEPYPARLCPSQIAERQHRARGFARAAAALLLVAVAGAAAGWFARGELGPDRVVAGSTESLASSALSAHRVYTKEVRHPVEVFADEEQHLARWISKRLDRPLTIPDLTHEGLKLIGGRLLADRGLPAAQFMYEDATGLRLTVYATTSDPGDETAFRLAQEGEYSAFYWRDGTLGCAIAAAMPRARLVRIANEVYAQLEASR